MKHYPAKTLFDPPIARSGDPITSYKAGDKELASGRFQYSVEQVRVMIKKRCRCMQKPDFTAKELAKFISEEEEIDYYKVYITVQKRLSVLENQLIERTGMERKDCMVWKLKG